MDISVHPSVAAIRDECVVAAPFEFNHFSMAETELILKSLDPIKATGHDQFPAPVLRDGASVLAAPFARLTNTVTDNACVPAEWKLAEICPIFKRDDEFDKSKYRPVSILVSLDTRLSRNVCKNGLFTTSTRFCLSSCQHIGKVTDASLCCCILSRTGKELLTRILWLGL